MIPDWAVVALAALVLVAASAVLDLLTRRSGRTPR